MRKIALIIALVLSASFSQAQDWGSGILVNAGTSLGSYAWGLRGGGYSRTGLSLPLQFSAEFGVAEDITVGPWFGYQTLRYNYNYGLFTSKYKYTVMAFGGKATYHGTNLLNEELDANLDENIDIYGSAYAGATLGSFSSSDALSPSIENTVGLNLGLVIGARYMFTDAFGAYVETGRGAMGYFSGGITLRL